MIAPSRAPVYTAARMPATKPLNSLARVSPPDPRERRGASSSATAASPAPCPARGGRGCTLQSSARVRSGAISAAASPRPGRRSPSSPGETTSGPATRWPPRQEHRGRLLPPSCPCHRRSIRRRRCRRRLRGRQSLPSTRSRGSHAPHGGTGDLRRALREWCRRP